MNIAIGSSQYGIHVTTWRWGIAVHVEWAGVTYGGQRAWA